MLERSSNAGSRSSTRRRAGNERQDFIDGNGNGSRVGFRATAVTEMIVAAGLLILLVLPAPASAQYSWSSSIVDRGGSVGTGSSLAFDAQDRPHISYFDEGAGSVKYAAWDGASWRLETVDTRVRVTGRTTLVLDPEGRPHISFADGIEIRYAHSDGVSWHVSSVDLSYSDGPNSLALGRDRFPRIAYAWNTGVLRFARWNGSAWLAETVETDTVIARHISLALDRNDRPSISYQGNGNLRYATNRGAGWVFEVVDSSGGSGLFSRLALDSADEPRIAYYNDQRRDPFFATWDTIDRAWKREVIDPDGDAGWDIALVLDTFDYPHVSYYERITADLRYAYRLGSAWQWQVVDSNGVVGWYSSIALNGLGLPSISYFDWNNGALKFAESRNEFQVRTLGAAAVGLDRAALRGAVNALGSYPIAKVSFEWRMNGSQTWTRTPSSWIGSPVMFSAALANLTAGTVYEFRAVGESAGLIYHGDEVRFRTLTPPPPPAFPVVETVAALAIIAAALFGWFFLRFRHRDPGPRLTRRDGRQRNVQRGARGVVAPQRRRGPV